MPPPVAAQEASPGVDWVEMDLSGADIDLTSASGPTGGRMARSLFIEGGGIIKFDTRGGTGRNPTVPDNFYLSCSGITKVYSTSGGTTATGVWAIL